MKNSNLILFISIIFSCQSQVKKEPTANNNNTSMNEQFNFEIYKNFEEDSDYRYTLPNKNIIVSMTYFKEDGGSQYETLPPPSFEVIYKEFYPNGNIKKKETYIGQNTKVGISEYYDEDGKITRINEDEKFGKIKPSDALKFLENKEVINLKTGEGILDKDGNPTFELNFDEESGKKVFIISILNGKPNDEPWDDIGEPPAYIPQNYEMNGETGEIKELD